MSQAPSHETGPTRPVSEWPGEILLVDDQPRFRMILKEFLQFNGFRVTTAASGEEAIDYLTRARPKVVLLDIRMQGMDGLSTLRHIRVQHPNLPVIIITQLDEEQARAEALALCSYEYLVKPFSFEHLKTVLLTKVFV